MRLLTFALACVPALFVACSETDPKVLTDQGTASLGSGDAKVAIARFDAALSRMDAAHPDYLRAQMGKCQALARQNPGEAKQQFLDLARQHPDRLKEADFMLVTGELLKRNATTEATEVVAAGKKMFPESAAMSELVQRVGDAATKSADPATMDKLKGLGYAGSDDP